LSLLKIFHHFSRKIATPKPFFTVNRGGALNLFRRKDGPGMEMKMVHANQAHQEALALSNLPQVRAGNK
jgi:hypothetical protein